jgi:ATP-dependent Lon protease
MVKKNDNDAMIDDKKNKNKKEKKNIKDKKEKKNIISELTNITEDKKIINAPEMSLTQLASLTKNSKKVSEANCAEHVESIIATEDSLEPFIPFTKKSKNVNEIITEEKLNKIINKPITRLTDIKNKEKISKINKNIDRQGANARSLRSQISEQSELDEGDSAIDIETIKISKKKKKQDLKNKIIKKKKEEFINEESSEDEESSEEEFIDEEEESSNLESVSNNEEDNEEDYEEENYDDAFDEDMATINNKSFKKCFILIPQQNFENNFYKDDEENEENDEEDEDYTEEDYKNDKKNIDKKKRKNIDFEKINPNYKSYSHIEKKYFEELPSKKRKLIGNIELDTNQINNVETPLRFKILDLQIDAKYKALALKKIEGMGYEFGGDNQKKKTWIDKFCRIPFGIYKDLPVNINSSKNDVSKFLINTKNILNENIYGNTFAKEQFLRILAQWIANPSSKGNVIGLHGAPGTGKTVFVKDAISKALDIPFVFIPLGGVSDSAFLTGFSFCYEGATPSTIVDKLTESKCMNPIFYFDELDKTGFHHGVNEITNTLIHITDPSQNEKFNDKYFSELDIDLSRALFVFTYNDKSKIDPILRDRMIQIDIDKYTNDDKVSIISDYIVPKLLEQFNFKKDEIILDNQSILYLINKTEKEAGVRNLKRNIELILSTINLIKITKDNDILKSKTIIYNYPTIIDNKLIDKLIKNNDKSNASFSHMYL